MPHRALTEMIPEHLRPYIVKQDPSLYTAIDHASWRFILKVARDFFATHAHPKYLQGLKETGISVERIPLIEEMDAALRKFGWRAVGITGFVPTETFFEFLSLGVLPIACDMRKLEHLSYTPAPDIVHEAAGHAPILADPEYAEYVRQYGELSRKVIFSHQDVQVYEAIRDLSDTKENPQSTPAQIEESQRRLDAAVASVTFVSEATELSRMGWWTTEYGLVGDPSNPKIYGAGLLSSVGESYHCLGPNVRKVPFSVDCVKQSFDITKPQPQLFVARSFHELSEGLEKFASTMAYRRGGREGLDKAVQCKTVTTTQLDTGIQISGMLTSWKADSKGEPAYLSFQGPSQLCYLDQEIQNQGPAHHKEGFGTPVGNLLDGRSPADLSEADLSAGKGVARLEFLSGVVVEGRLMRATREGGKNLILTFDECTVSLGSEILFKPEWGVFDMACGTRVVSVFGGSGDRVAYLRATGGRKIPPQFAKTNLTTRNRELNQLYAEVREIREKRPADAGARLANVFAELESRWTEDWLLRFELLELDQLLGLRAAWAAPVRTRLEGLAHGSRETGELIARGLASLAKVGSA